MNNIKQWNLSTGDTSIIKIKTSQDNEKIRVAHRNWAGWMPLAKSQTQEKF